MFLGSQLDTEVTPMQAINKPAIIIRMGGSRISQRKGLQEQELALQGYLHSLLPLPTPKHTCARTHIPPYPLSRLCHKSSSRGKSLKQVKIFLPPPFPSMISDMSPPFPFRSFFSPASFYCCLLHCCS